MEKRGNFIHPHSLIRGFREAIEECELKEVRMCGYQFVGLRVPQIKILIITNQGD